jgi:hypothetical protein
MAKRELTKRELQNLADCAVGGPLPRGRLRGYDVLYVRGLIEWNLNHGRFVPTAAGLAELKKAGKW